MDPWLIGGDDPPASEMAFSSNFFQLQCKGNHQSSDPHHTFLNHRGSANEEKLLRVFLWWCSSHQLVDLALCGTDDIEGFVVYKESTGLGVIVNNKCLRRDDSLTSSYWADQQRIQLHQRAETGLAVSAPSSASTQPAGWVPQLQSVVWAPLQQDEAVW